MQKQEPGCLEFSRQSLAAPNEADKTEHEMAQELIEQVVELAEKSHLRLVCALLQAARASIRRRVTLTHSPQFLPVDFIYALD